MSDKPIKTLRRNVIHKNRWYTVEDNPVEFPGGSKGNYFRVTTNAPYRNAVIVLPIFPDNSIGLIRQFQYGIDAWDINAPKGFGKEGKTPRQTAMDELLEETGLVAGTLVKRGRPLSADTGLYTTKLNFFFALDCKQEKNATPEASEAIAKKLIVIPYDRIDELLEKQCIPKGIEIVDDQGYRLDRPRVRKVTDLMTLYAIQNFRDYSRRQTERASVGRSPHKRPHSRKELAKT